MSKKNEKTTETATETPKLWASKTGQTGPTIEVAYEDLNRKEQKVLAAIDPEKKGTRPLKKIQEIGDEAFTGMKHANQEKRNSWTRNSLRRLVRSEFVEHGEEKGDGTYRITEKGRKRVARALSQEAATAKPKRSRTVSASRIQPTDSVQVPTSPEEAEVQEGASAQLELPTESAPAE